MKVILELRTAVTSVALTRGVLGRNWQWTTRNFRFAGRCGERVPSEDRSLTPGDLQKGEDRECGARSIRLGEKPEAASRKRN